MVSRKSSLAAAKKFLVWLLVLSAGVGVAVAYYAIWVMLSVYAFGVVWWAAGAVFFSGPLALVAVPLAWVRPRQQVPVLLASACFAAWLILWLLMFAAGFRFGV